MKTKVVMNREMGEYLVHQRSSDGFFNATSLCKQFNEKNSTKKEVTKFFELENTKEFIDQLIIEEDLNTQDHAYLKSRGKYGGTWMTPILFIKFAMWLNVRFEIQVIKFVYDQLLDYRDSAGDNYKELSSSVQRLPEANFQLMAKGLNYIVFGKHEKGIRNSATTYQLKELNDLQKKLSFAVDMGYIKSFDGLLAEMRRIWHSKNQ